MIRNKNNPELRLYLTIIQKKSLPDNELGKWLANFSWQYHDRLYTSTYEGLVSQYSNRVAKNKYYSKVRNASIRRTPINKLNMEDKRNIEIVRTMLELLKPWHNLIKEPRKDSIFTTDELRKNITLVAQMIQNSELSELEVNIINDSLINNEYSMDRICRKYHFSDSSLRNRVNLILKKIADRNL